MAFCAKCGAQLEDDAVFCQECGSSTDAAAQGNAMDNTAKAGGSVNVLDKKNKRSTAMCDNGSCPYVYDSNDGDPEHGIQSGTRYEDIPVDWVCPLCGKREFTYTV
jgi:rubredoxin